MSGVRALRGLLCCLAFGSVLLASYPGPTAELDETFDKRPLDTTAWNPCQLDGAPLAFEERTDAAGTLRRVLKVIVASATGNKKTCVEVEPLPPASATRSVAPQVTLDVEDETDFGPSLIQPSLRAAQDALECPQGDPSIQRNELRLRKNRLDLVHAQTDPHWYSITFRADGYIPSCGSARWIIAQWKQERGERGDEGPSPFLAERFDNGVLHVTVQNGHCRCVVAQAPGDFDTVVALKQRAFTMPTLQQAKPLKCIRTDLAEGAPETACRPTGLTVMTLGGTAPPPLPDPKRDWVRMTYFVRGGFDGKGQVDVYAGKQFVVRVLGLIGYETPDPGKVKFKFGHYRDRIAGIASISVDRLCFSKDLKVCAPDLEIVAAPE